VPDQAQSAPAALAVVYRPLEALIPYAQNARTHSDEQVAQIARSIAEFGWTNPVLVDAKGGIVAGHGRVLAARRLGLVEVPTIELAHLTEAQRRAYVIADNQLALNAGWDNDLLRLEIADLTAAGFDVGLLGFDTDALAAIMSPGSGGLTDPDDAPPAPDNPVSVLGDVWLLGRHRITCGDCTDKVVVDRVLAGVRPHLMVTDPPYGVNYDPAWRQRVGVGSAGYATGKLLLDDFGAHFVAARRGLVAQLEQGLDLGQRENAVLGLLDEAQALHRLRAVQPVAAAGLGRHLH
jgi:hypothetical protein